MLDMSFYLYDHCNSTIYICVSSRELVSSLSTDSSIVVAGSAQSLSVRAWFRCVLQQHLHKNPDGSDSRTGIATMKHMLSNRQD